MRYFRFIFHTKTGRTISSNLWKSDGRSDYEVFVDFLTEHTFGAGLRIPTAVFSDEFVRIKSKWTVIADNSDVETVDMVEERDNYV